MALYINTIRIIMHLQELLQLHTQNYELLF